MKSNCGYPLYWRNCYSDSYDLIAPESYAHPAKMTPALNFRILEHLEELGLLKKGDTILDPMGGTGLTAITAGAKGYKSITVELEEKFCNFQKQNKQYAERKLYKQIDWQIIQGDSRKLSELLTEKGLVSVTSPPYEETIKGSGADVARKRIAEGKYIGKRPDVWTSEGNKAGSTYGDSYSKDPSNIGNMKDTPLKVITSPPYGIDMKTAGGIDWGKANRPERRIEVNPKTGKAYTRHNVYGVNVGGYGENEDNLGNLPDKPLKAITSPPYDMGDGKGHAGDDSRNIIASKGLESSYGDNEGQLGQEQGESYLSAMLKVYQEIAKISDVLAIVIKNPTRNKQLRRLDLDTIKILELAGWVINCTHRALLFEELEQADMFNGSQKKVKGRMSFFKRLSWQNGQPVASWEDVIIATTRRKTPE